MNHICDHSLLMRFDGEPRILTEDYIANDTDVGYIKNLLDGRKGYSQKFKYCPDCGDKIDWKEIREMI